MLLPYHGLTWNLVGGMVSDQRPRTRSKVTVTLRSRSLQLPVAIFVILQLCPYRWPYLFQTWYGVSQGYGNWFAWPWRYGDTGVKVTFYPPPVTKPFCRSMLPEIYHFAFRCIWVNLCVFRRWYQLYLLCYCGYTTFQNDCASDCLKVKWKVCAFRCQKEKVSSLCYWSSENKNGKFVLLIIQKQSEKFVFVIVRKKKFDKLVPTIARICPTTKSCWNSEVFVSKLQQPLMFLFQGFQNSVCTQLLIYG